MVEQRHAALERSRHRHLVRQHQDVVGQLRVGVDREHAGQHVFTPRGLEAGANRVQALHRRPHKQRGRFVGREHPDIGTVAFGERRGRGTEEILREARVIEPGRVPIARQHVGQPRGATFCRLRQPVDVAHVVLAEVAAITTEELVAADPRENDLHVAARELSHQEGRDQRTVGDRLVHVPQQLGQQPHDVGLDQDLVVIGAEELGDFARVVEFVVETLRRAAVETDRIGLDG